MLLALSPPADTLRTRSTNKDVGVVNITLPYLNILNRYDDFTANKLDDVFRKALASSRRRPAYVEVRDGSQQCYTFFRNGQIYSAGVVRNGGLAETTIKEFLVAVNRMETPRAACFEVDTKILHSLLILLQKKPTLKLLTSLVDLDQVLDKIEDEGKSCVVSASQDEFLAVLRYEKGETKALCHELSKQSPSEQSFREDFLVKIYTLSAEKPLTINVYEDLLVRYATDTKMIDEKYEGSITDLFISKPPIVTLELKGKEIGHWMLDKPVFKIGRTEENDIAIDNLAVSRTHSVIEEDKGEYYVKDCDSMNGTLVNGNRVGRALLCDGDEIQIGKHTLTFQRQSGRRITLSPAPVGFDQTVIIHPDKATPPPIQTSEVSIPRPRLVEKTNTGGRVFEIGDSSLTLGKDKGADVEIGGIFVANRHAEIYRENGGYVIRHVAGRRRVKVGGTPVKECVLRDNDLIAIGSKEFVFHE